MTTKIDFQALLGKKIRICITQYDGHEKGFVPTLYEGVLSNVEGTNIWVTECSDFCRNPVPDTSFNTSALFFNWLQPLE